MTNSNSANAESKNLTLSCYKLQEMTNVSFTARLEVVNLAKELETNVLNFSVLEFFDMNHDTLFGIFATTLTYIIILIQYDGPV